MKKLSFVKKTLALVAASLLTMPVLAVWTVKDGNLLDPNGNTFIFRGAVIDSTLAPERVVQGIKDIAAAGANAVQVEINANMYGSTPPISGAQLRTIIDTCKTNKIICVLEPNDVAGYPDFANAGIPATAGLFWSTWPADIREAIIGQHDYIMLGFGNQSLAPMSAGEYINRMMTYLEDFNHPLLRNFVIVVDGSGWSQDADKAMLELAKQMAPRVGSTLPHLIYSVDMFDTYLTPESVRNYIAEFTAAGFPLVIGGFGPTAYYHPNNTSPRPAVVYDLPEDAVMQYAQQYGVGYFGWSWSGNKNSALDLVSNWSANNFTPWGNLLFNGTNGIKATAKPASIFNASSSSASSSSVPANQPPVAAITYNLEYVRCGQVYGNVTASGSSDPDGDPLTYQWDISGYGSPITSTSPSLRFYMQPPHYYTIKLTVSDGKGGVASTSIIRNHTYSDNCISSSVSSSSIRPSSSSIPSVSSVPSSVGSSSIRPTSVSSSSRSASSVAVSKAQCSYVINSQWNTGFTASIRIKNTTSSAINGWDVNWQYNDDSKVTNLWNANLSGSNPYNAKNLSWNSTIQPGQTVEFGFQGSKSAAVATIPAVKGDICQ